MGVKGSNMLRELRAAFRMLVVLTVLTGVLYPLVVTGVAQGVLPTSANGSAIVENGVVRGSKLIGQSFEHARWFSSRPSATGPVPYNASASSGSNLGPTNPALAELLKARVDRLRADGITAAIPADLVTASGSGLDPHISPAAARIQVQRVARARGLEPEQVRLLVEDHVDGPTFGILGEATVNVLELNLALDKLR
jgi:K+-transporting ATPase ATPase C chain